MRRHGFDLEDFYKIVELTDGAISPNGRYVAFVSSHWDIEADGLSKRSKYYPFTRKVIVWRAFGLLHKREYGHYVSLLTTSFSPSYVRRPRTIQTMNLLSIP